MSDDKVVVMYDEAIELAGGENLYVPGETDLVPVSPSSPLTIYTPLQDSGLVGRSPWDWTAQVQSRLEGM